MSFFTEIDRLLRHSVLARAQPFIREKTPWLHKALLSARDLLLPVPSQFGTSRYQHRAIERFLSFSPDLSGNVLEIGSDPEGAALKELSSRGVRNPVGLNISVDPAVHAGRESKDIPRYEILQGDVRKLPFRDCSISSIFSITAFEHIHDFDVALAEMHRVLQPGGIVYSDFGPIWSCSVGHHVYAIVDGAEARHWKPGKNPVPHYAHLLMSPEELRAAVLQKSWVFPKLADAIVHQIYEGDAINRLFYEDYVKHFDASSFRVRLLEPVYEHVPARIQQQLEQRYPGHKEFGIRMAEVVLEKS